MDIMYHSAFIVLCFMLIVPVQFFSFELLSRVAGLKSVVLDGPPGKHGNYRRAGCVKMS